MKHGTRYAWFTKGCRCTACKIGRQDDDRERRRRRFERAKADPSIIKHGTSLGYTDYGCRCDLCRTANREEVRRQRGGQPRKTWTEDQITHALEVYARSGSEEAGRTVNANTSTVRRWASERGVKYERPIKHGTRNTYARHNCRCEECVRATKADLERQQAERLARKDQAPHGTVSGYRNWGCRCDPCRAAGAADNARARAKRKALGPVRQSASTVRTPRSR